MTPNWNHHFFKLLSGILAKLALLTELVLVAGNCDRAQAQIIPDRSLGAEASVVTPNVEIKGLPAERIDGGAIRDSNLFHSFQEFNIGDLQRVYFANPAGITNIFSRVTGSNLSEIFGTLGVNGSANLFFINPNGIIFGENARLDIGGSFLGSTADSLLFPEGEFSAVDLDNPPLLTINAPIGLNLGDKPAPITNRSFAQNSTGTKFVGLEIPPGTNLTLVGGDINFEAGEVTVLGGRVDLGGLAEAGTVTINENGSLSFPEGIARADVTFTNAAFVDVRGAGGGSITVNARNIELSGGEFGASSLLAGIARDSGSTTAQAGDIILNATDTISVSQGSRILNRVEESGVGNAGGIDITTANLSLTQGGQVSANTFGQGDAGAIAISASETISADGETQAGSNSGIGSQVGPTAVGNSGGIDLTTAKLFLTQGGRVIASTFGQGDAGAITINASEIISADGEDGDGFSSAIVSQVADTGVGNSGGIDLTTAKLFLTQGGVVNASTFGRGNAGAITINASETISVDGENQAGFSSGIISQVLDKVVGNSGGINLTTAKLSLTQGGQISTSTFGAGNAGAIAISASETISVEGEDQAGRNSGIFSQVVGVGKSGEINLTTAKLSLTQGGVVDASTFGRGNAGAITINASDTISVEGETQARFTSGIFSTVQESGVGNSDGIDLTTANLFLTQGGVVEASTAGEGDAGAVMINATDTISADGTNSEGFSSGIFSRVDETAIGNAGGIDLTTVNLSLTNEAEISVESSGQGNAGDLSIQANSIALSNGASLLASTPVGTGGNITLQIADNLTLRNNSTISAQATGDANGGNVNIAADLIVAFPQENSDIKANAFEGKGGNINIDAQNIFGFQLQENPNLSDITASSQFGLDGTININTSGIEPGQESIELPIEIIDVSKLIERNLCSAGQEGEFIITGKGGLSPAPQDTLNTDAGWEDWRMVENSQSNYQQSSQTRSLPEVNNYDSHQIVEAQSWFIAPNGNIILSAQPVKSVSRNSSFLPLNCQLLDEVKQ